jgi:hypothetical protein
MSDRNIPDENDLTPEQKANWLAGLRSGQYPQGQDVLGTPEYGLCCLGVFCVVNNIPFEPHETGCAEGPRRLFDALGYDARGKLANMNDGGKSFAEIADWIEANL